MDVDDWIGKMERKLTENTDHYPTEQARITYVDSFVKYPASLHLAPRLKDNAINKFTTAKKIFDALCAAYEDTDKEHTAHVKFYDLWMTKDFNSFWVEFLALASKLNSNESTLIIEM